MSARPLDHVLPARRVIALVGVRARLARARSAAARVWHVLQPWLAGAALVLAFGVIAAWLEAMDAKVLGLEERRRRVEVEHENVELQARVAELEARRGDRPTFYLVEARSIGQAIDKMQSAWLSIASQQHELMLAEPRETKRK